MLPEGGRALPDVHGDIKHLAFNHADELTLRKGTLLVMESPYNPVAAHALVVLHESYGTNHAVEVPLGI